MAKRAPILGGLCSICVCVSFSLLPFVPIVCCSALFCLCLFVLGQFAVWGALFSTADCSLQYLRRKDDSWNAIVAGGATSALLSARGSFSLCVPSLLNDLFFFFVFVFFSAGPRAMGRSGLLGAVILAMIEGLSGGMSKSLRALQPAPPRGPYGANCCSFGFPFFLRVTLSRPFCLCQILEPLLSLVLHFLLCYIPSLLTRIHWNGFVQGFLLFFLFASTILISLLHHHQLRNLRTEN